MSTATEPEKPVIRVGTLGESGHGKTTLSAAILACQVERGFASDKSSALLKPLHGSDPTRLATVKLSYFEYETKLRHYAHIDLPASSSFNKSLITGVAQMDGAILVVSEVGPSLITREHVILARQVVVPAIIVFLNEDSRSRSERQLDASEAKTRTLLSEYGFDAATIPFIRGSALNAAQHPADPDARRCIDELLAAMDAFIPVPVPEEDKPFLLAIEDVFSIVGKGTIATGRVERGVIRVGDEVEIVGLDKVSTLTTVLGIEQFRKSVEQGRAGDNVGLVLRGVTRDEVLRGQTIVKPGSITALTDFEAQIEWLARDEGGRAIPLISGYRPQFYFRTTDVSGIVELAGASMQMPGNEVKVGVKLDKPVALEEGLRFAVRENGKTIGTGIVTRLSRPIDSAFRLDQGRGKGKGEEEEGGEEEEYEEEEEGEEESTGSIMLPRIDDETNLEGTSPDKETNSPRKYINAWLAKGELPLIKDQLAVIAVNIGARKSRVIAASVFREPDWGHWIELDVIVCLSGPGAKVTPTSHPLKIFKHGASAEIRFEVIPRKQGDVILNLSIYLAKELTLLEELELSLPVRLAVEEAIS